MDFTKKVQTQTAGDNAVQNQIENQNNYNSTQVCHYYGASPTEIVSIAASVYNQMYTLSAKNYADIAATTVEERINAFRCILFPRLEKIEGALEKFKDPRFEFLLCDAQVAAAKSNRHDDLCMLSELLSCHVLKGDDKKIDAGISHAIKIVDEIDNDALCALTVLCAFQFYLPTSGIINEGLKTLNELYGKLMYLKLPTGFNWLDHLDMLGALRMSSLHLKTSKDYICSRLPEYSSPGIKKGSMEYDKAKEILDEYKLSQSNLVDNDCMKDYVRIKVADINSIKSEFIEPISKIRNLYTKDKNAIKTANVNFINLWDSFEVLKIVREWWDEIPYAFSVSCIGRVLAQTNAKRIDPSLPDLI